MGIIQKFNGKRPQGAAPPPPTTPSASDDREPLRRLARELAKACECVADVDARLDRLVKIIRDADAAHIALQEAIKADGGIALAEYAAGNAADAPIAKLIAAEETTAKAAAAAKVALPNAQAMLNAAQAEVKRLEQEKEHAVIAYLRGRADEVAARYRNLFSALCRTHDELAGISAALLPTSPTGREIKMSSLPITVPRFDLPATADPNEYLPTMVHHSDERSAGQSTADWMQARALLAADVEASLDGVIGLKLAYPEDYDL